MVQGRKLFQVQEGDMVVHTVFDQVGLLVAIKRRGHTDVSAHIQTTFPNGPLLSYRYPALRQATPEEVEKAGLSDIPHNPYRKDGK